MPKLLGSIRIPSSFLLHCICKKLSMAGYVGVLERSLKNIEKFGK